MHTKILARADGSRSVPRGTMGPGCIRVAAAVPLIGGLQGSKSGVRQQKKVQVMQRGAIGADEARTRPSSVV